MLLGVCWTTRVQSVFSKYNTTVLREVVPTPSRRYTVLPLKCLLAYKSEHAYFVTLCTTNVIHLTEPVSSYMGVGCPTSDQWACMLLGVYQTSRV